MSDKNQLRMYAIALRDDLRAHSGWGEDPANLSARVRDYTKHHAKKLYNYLFPPPPEHPKHVDAEPNWAVNKLTAPGWEVVGLHVRVKVGLEVDESLAVSRPVGKLG